MCGKVRRPDKKLMNRIKEPFEALKAPYHHTSPIITRDGKCGPNPWQEHHKARDTMRSAMKGDKKYTSIWDRWQHDDAYRTSQLAHNWSDAWVRYLDHIVHFDIGQKGKQAGSLWMRPGYQEANKELANLQKAQRQAQVPYIPVSERKRQNNNVASMSHRYKRLHEHRIFTRPSRSEVLIK